MTAPASGFDQSIRGTSGPMTSSRERAHDGRKFRILTIIDEASRECLVLIVSRQLRHEDVLAALADLFMERGPPAHIRSDNGSEFIATAVQTWLGQIGVKDALHRPGLAMGERL